MQNTCLDINQLEILAQHLYQSSDAGQRSEAEKLLTLFETQPDCLERCQSLLERSSTVYSQMLATSTLIKRVSRVTPPLISIQQRIDLRNYILTYLFNCPKHVNFVQQSFSTLYAKITKVSWLDTKNDEFISRNVIEDITHFIQGTPDQCVLGVQLLTQLTNEMNNPFSSSDHDVVSNRQNLSATLGKHRKICSSFKDVSLYPIFQLSCSMLQTLYDSLKSTPQNSEQLNLMKSLLKLLLSCLSFDFSGNASDESSDDLSTVQIPSSWRTSFTSPCAPLSTLFDIFKLTASHAIPSQSMPTSSSSPSSSESSESCGSLSMSSIVQFASIRRTVLNSDERKAFLNQIMSEGVRVILINEYQTGSNCLSDSNVHHQFCRLLSRLKSHYQLDELVSVDSYSETMDLVLKFSVDSLTKLITKHPSSHSIHYILSLWQRMVGSVPYVKSGAGHRLEIYAPQVALAYITSRVNGVDAIVRDGLEDPLDDLGSVNQQLDQISVICRMEYVKCCRMLCEMFDNSAQIYQNAINETIVRSGSVSANNKALPPQQTNAEGHLIKCVKSRVEEVRMTWLVYFIGACIRGRVSFNCSDDQDAMDGDLAVRTLQLINFTDSKLTQFGGCECLELSMLNFFDQFRRIYVGDSSTSSTGKSSEVYSRLSQVVGVSNENMLLALIVRKLVTNLKYLSQFESVLEKSLSLLSDLSTGYSTVRKLCKLDEINYLLAHHTSQNYPFLGSSISIESMKCRSTFYGCLGRILLIELGDDEEKFFSFISPFISTADSLLQVFQSSNLSSTSTNDLVTKEQIRRTVIGFARDLRGFCESLNSKIAFMLFFDWFHPKYTLIFSSAIQIWASDPQVSIPVLKFYCEFVQNRSQRLVFDVSSPNGVLLFREVSKIICTYGSVISQISTVSDDKIYSDRLKGIGVVFTITRLLFCGNFVNFGVVRLYGDSTLDNALSIYTKLVLMLNQSQVMQYPKLCQAYYSLLESITCDHMDFVCESHPSLFLFMLNSISQGFSSLGSSINVITDTVVCAACCISLDYITTYLFKQVVTARNKKVDISPLTSQSKVLRMVTQTNPEVLQQILNHLLQYVVFQDSRQLWAMSRPLLGLILLNEVYFERLTQQICMGQTSTEIQTQLTTLFKALMTDIQRNLLVKNKDRFSQNLSVFRRDIQELFRSQNIQTTANSDESFGVSMASASRSASLTSEMMS